MRCVVTPRHVLELCAKAKAGTIHFLSQHQFFMEALSGVRAS